MFLANRVGVSTATTGTGTITLGTALGAVAPNVASYQSFANGGITDQAEVPYVLLDANGNWEYGFGTYTLAGTTFTRTVIGSNNSNNAINLSGSAQLFVGALSTPGGGILEGFPNPFRGFDAPINLQINASVGSNILTVAVKNNQGNDASINSPIYIPFRDPTATAGDPIWRRITGALSITTNAVGASLGSINNNAFRFWLVAFDNAGTIVLGLINCSTSSQIFPMNEGVVASTTAMSGSATSAGTFYTPNGTTLTNKAFRIIGYVEYNSTGLATAGTYASAPNFIQLFGPGIKKPGDSVQRIYATSTTAGTAASTTFVALTSGITVALAPTSAVNLIRVLTAGLQVVSSANFGRLQLSRGVVANTNLFGNVGGQAIGANNAMPTALYGMDAPNTTSSTTYAIQGKVAISGTISFPWSNGDAVCMEAEELMG